MDECNPLEVFWDPVAFNSHLVASSCLRRLSLEMITSGEIVLFVLVWRNRSLLERKSIQKQRYIVKFAQQCAKADRKGTVHW